MDISPFSHQKSPDVIGLVFSGRVRDLSSVQLNRLEWEDGAEDQVKYASWDVLDDQ